MIPSAAATVQRVVWRDSGASSGERVVPEEVPVALTYNRGTHAVMLATPADLEDFAVGFSLAEGIVASVADILDLAIVPLPQGIEARMELRPALLDALTRRQRRIAGPSGCGLCGMDSLTEAVRAVPTAPSGGLFSPAMVRAAMEAMPAAQRLNLATRAVHAAGFWTPQAGLVALREDVGRHNALDKLAGALARGGGAPSEGMVLLSSRVSVEMVQKAAIMGAAVVVAVSAPTALAIRTADAAGLTLIGVARQDGFEVFTHPRRIEGDEVRHVA